MGRGGCQETQREKGAELGSSQERGEERLLPPREKDEPDRAVNWSEENWRRGLLRSGERESSEENKFWEF